MENKEKIEQLGIKYAITHKDVSDKLSEYLVSACFQDGYTQCQEEMADKKYTEEDMYNCWQTAFTDAMNIREKDYKPIWFSDFINSLNKQD